MSPGSPASPLRSARVYWIWVAAVIVCGLILRWDALSGSLLADDWDHYAMDAGVYPIARHPLDRFDFVRADAREREALIASGRFPWWTDSAIHLAVLRPLSSALVHLDFRVLDAAHHPLRAHLHTLLWWILLVVGIAGCMRRVLPPAPAAIAVLLFALHGSHGLPVAWSANRSELIALACVVWGLWAYLRARLDGSRSARWLAAVGVGLGLLAGEHAIAPLAYFACFEALAADGGRRERARALAPIALLAVAYLALRAALGYGVAGSSFYIDPVHNPLRFTTAASTRLPILSGDLVFGWPAESSTGGPLWEAVLFESGLLPEGWLTLQRAHVVQVAIGVLALTTLIAACTLTRRARASVPWRNVSWLVSGALLALIPASGGLPMSRLTMSSAIGVDALLGALAWTLVAQRAVLSALGLGLLAAIHVFSAAIRTRNEVTYYADRSHVEEAWALHAELPKTGIADKHVLIISAPDWISQFGVPYVRHLHGLELPASTEALSAAVDSTHVVTRTGDATLELRLEPEAPGRPFASSVYRAENSRFDRGQLIHAPRFDVYVAEVRDGEPSVLEFRFRHNLDDPRYIFLYPRPSGLVHLPHLDIGQRLRLPPPVWPSRLVHQR